MDSTVENVIVCVAIVAVVGGTLVALWMEPQRRALRSLRKKPTAIEALGVGGAATITGEVRALGESKATSLSGQPCVFSRIEVLHFYRRRNTDGNISEAWKPVGTEERGGSFLVEDGTGAVQVDPSGALWPRPTYERDIAWDQLTEEEEELFSRLTRVERGMPARVRETLLFAGNPVIVHGHVGRDDATQRATISAKGRRLLAIANAMDG